MKRFRLSTLLLLVVIAALIVALAARERRHAREIAEARQRIEELQRSRLGPYVWWKGADATWTERMKSATYVSGSNTGDVLTR